MRPRSVNLLGQLRRPTSCRTRHHNTEVPEFKAENQVRGRPCHVTSRVPLRSQAATTMLCKQWRFGGGPGSLQSPTNCVLLNIFVIFFLSVQICEEQLKSGVSGFQWGLSHTRLCSMNTGAQGSASPPWPKDPSEDPIMRTQEHPISAGEASIRSRTRQLGFAISPSADGHLLALNSRTESIPRG